MEKNYKFILSLLFGIVLFSSLISAGIGLKWEQQSKLVLEGEKACLTYGVYNPFSDDSYVQIDVSDSLKTILLMQDTKSTLIPAQTSSQNTIPVEFCFEVPKVYQRNYLIAGRFIEKLDCNEPQKEYNGEVVVKTVAPPSDIGGSGGSTTQMSVGAPITVRVPCEKHGWDYTPVYVLVAFISLFVLVFTLFRKYRKPKDQRIKEKMQKLKKEMQKSKKR
jgi:hypothetical protein